MKKRFMIPFAVLAAVSLFTTQAFAATSMFGEVPQRTHDNGIDDPLPWKQVANISSATTTDGTSQAFNVSGNGTAVAQNNTLVFPVSSQNDDPTQWGDLAVWDFSNWSNGQPKLMFANAIKGVSNSSPVIHDGVSYLAAGGTLYGYDQAGTLITLPAPGNISSPNAANDPESQADSELINQVVSHPLYTTAAQTGANQDLIWVSSQNGYLYAINPSNLLKVYAINIGSRMDGSPTLVTDTAGTTYIAVATAYSAANKGGTGTLYVIDPRTGTVVSSLANPAGNNSPVVTAPVATGTGYIMWNDYAGDVFFGRLNPDSYHSITKEGEWDQVDGSGQTTNQEAGYSTQTGQYILPFSSDSMVVYVDPNTSGSTPIPVPISGKAISSPAISKDNIYVGDAGGYVDQLMNVKGFTKEDAPYIGGTSGNVNGVQNLASVMESSLQSPVAGVGNIPTLAFAGNDGLHVWQSMGAIYSIGTDYTAQYTNGQPATFDPSKPITVTQTNSNLSASLSGIMNEEIDISYSVDGKAPQYLTGFKVFNTDGSPVTSFQIPASDLAKIPTTWTDGKTHKVTFNVYANTNDAYGYTFDSADSGNNQQVASATVTFSTQQESIKLSPASETVPSGTPVNLSYTVSGMQAGDTVKVVPSGNGVGMWRVSGDKKATDSTTETEASTTNPIDVSYTAVVADKNGNQVANDNTTITWSPGKGNQPLNPKDDTPSLYENPVTQKLDFGVNLTDWLWDHWPRMGDIGKVNVELINKSYNTIYDKDGNKEIIGGYLDYSITATSENPYFQGFSKSGEVFVAPGDNAPVIINIPFNYTVAQRQDPRKGYFIKFTVNVWSKDKTIPGKPPTYIAALPDSDPSNDTAVLNMWIPSATVVTR